MCNEPLSDENIQALKFDKAVLENRIDNIDKHRLFNCSTCSVQLTCHIFIFFFIHGFQSSIFHKLKKYTKLSIETK